MKFDRLIKFNKNWKFIIQAKIKVQKNKIKFIVDRLYENMLELIRDSQEQDSNSTLCNLNESHSRKAFIISNIVIVHYVI